MLGNLIRFFRNNLGTFILAFLMGVAVWISAVVAADPNEERSFPGDVELDVIGQDSSLLLIGEIPARISVTLSAPRSLWDRLISEPDAIQATLDLSQAGPGEFVLPVEVTVNLQLVRILVVSPVDIHFTLEPLVSIDFPITPLVTGEPALGFQIDRLTLAPLFVTISGPQSLVELVSEVRGAMDISGTRTAITTEATLRIFDAEGELISGLKVEPSTVSLTQEIQQSGGFREVSVTVNITGQPASGYRVTNISVSPPTVTISSSNPDQVEDLPGFVRTLPLDISEEEDDVEIRLALDLPEGVTVVGEQSVQVLVGIAAIQSSIPASISVEVIGLQAGLAAILSPEVVDVILAGPVRVLDELAAEDVRFFVDLTDLDIGTYVLEPIVEILPDRLQIESFTPIVIEVIIQEAEIIEETPTPGPTATPN